MKVNQDQLILAISRYFENEILMKAPTGLQKFKISFVYGALKSKLPSIIIEVLNKIYEKNKNYSEMEEVELILDELLENLKNSHNYIYMIKL